MYITLNPKKISTLPVVRSAKLILFNRPSLVFAVNYLGPTSVTLHFTVAHVKCVKKSSHKVNPLSRSSLQPMEEDEAGPTPSTSSGQPSSSSRLVAVGTDEVGIRPRGRPTDATGESN